MSKPFDPVKAAQEIVVAEAEQFKCVVCGQPPTEEHCDMMHDGFNIRNQELQQRGGWQGFWTRGNGHKPYEEEIP